MNKFNDPMTEAKLVLAARSVALHLPVYFKKQKPWTHHDTSDLEFIKSSTNKCDMPQHSLVVWVASGNPTWRYTGGFKVPGTNYPRYTRHFEVEQWHDQLYINGCDLHGSIETMQVLLNMMRLTYPILNKVYGTKLGQSNSPMFANVSPAFKPIRS